MRFTAYDQGGTLLGERAYYSAGGGFVADETAGELDKYKETSRGGLAVNVIEC